MFRVSSTDFFLITSVTDVSNSVHIGDATDDMSRVSETADMSRKYATRRQIF